MIELLLIALVLFGVRRVPSAPDRPRAFRVWPIGADEVQRGLPVPPWGGESPDPTMDTLGVYTYLDNWIWLGTRPTGAVVHWAVLPKVEQTSVPTPLASGSSGTGSLQANIDAAVAVIERRRA